MFDNALAQPLKDATANTGAHHLLTILYGGLLAGALDITAAFINSALHGRSLIGVLQSIAGGLLGRGAYQGGWKTATLGFVLHFCIATIWAALYYAASLKLPLLTRHTIVCGLLYGVVVYACMYLIVLPLSALQFKFFNQPADAILTGVLIHLFCVGLPIALTVRWRTQ
ncbi:MAG: hypothetical protein HYR56_11570 [Acidobacteria bacterium]|nr:hypothetical protein [Acidobacteriota bacterium]MBI3422537.1 hypothetical protein [Acidobacteriota bacterium]